MGNGMSSIEHVIVLMLENRSFDNLVGWLYAADGNVPSRVLPADRERTYDGLVPNRYFNEFQGKSYYAVPNTDGLAVPTPDPNEEFDHMTAQIFGAEYLNKPVPDKTPATMSGFVDDYATAKHSSAQNAPTIMQCATPDQLTAMSALARSYAIGDRWFASTPTQTWPNRSFLHAGTSSGHVNNGWYLPFQWTAKTIFNVFEEKKVSWKVYYSQGFDVLGYRMCLTRFQMQQLHSFDLDDRFAPIDEFYADAAAGRLPSYVFLEPTWEALSKTKATSEHPPADVCYGEHFLAQVYAAVRGSPCWNQTLFVVTYDEHGGCYDHCPTPWGAICPGKESDPGDEGFRFNRFGVRVPTILISPWIEPGTVFRSPTSLPYDHTSILATLLDWQGVSRSELESERVRSPETPTLDSVLTRTTPRTDDPVVQAKCVPAAVGDDASVPLNAMGQAIVSAVAQDRFRGDPEQLRLALESVRTRGDAREFVRDRLT